MRVRLYLSMISLGRPENLALSAAVSAQSRAGRDSSLCSKVSSVSIGHREAKPRSEDTSSWISARIGHVSVGWARLWRGTTVSMMHFRSCSRSLNGSEMADKRDMRFFLNADVLYEVSITDSIVLSSLRKRHRLMDHFVPWAPLAVLY